MLSSPMGAIYLAPLLLSSLSLAQEAGYRVLDQIRGTQVELSSFPTRPLIRVPAAGTHPAAIWAVNTHQDLVERFAVPGPASPFHQSPTLSVSTGWNPVALAYSASNDEVLVACRGTYAIFRFHARTGHTLGAITLTPSDFGGAVDRRGHGLMAEPSDILVDDETDMAFVSCAGADAVIQIDLSSHTVVRRFHASEGLPVSDPAFRLKTPVFLSFGSRPTPTAPRTVLVAPQHSGNGTTVSSIEIPSGPPLIDRASAFGLNDLPDEDLFAIRPLTANSLGSVQPVLRATGTILFAQGVHPETGAHWQLNTEAHNGGPANASEPLVNGRFATNRLTITHNFGAPNEIQTVHPLEDGGLAGPAGSGLGFGQGIGQPYALAFGGAGRAYIAGVLSDNVVKVGAAAELQRHWSLPNGSIPRGLLPIQVGIREHVLVYCWGTNEILRYNPSGTGSGPLAPVGRMALRADTSPDPIRRGRKLFFDGSRSATGTLSCATCHVEGGADGLAWDLSPIPFHSKRPMVTQTLIGIEKLGPFHWRGERDLIDFNPAFEGLLGNHDPASMNQLSPQEFADFKAFIFSLRNPANPNQSRSRRVSATLHNANTAAPGNAIAGQDAFFDEQTLGKNTCAECHSAPTGTSSDVFPIFGAVREPVRTQLLPTALHELWRKEQPTVDLGPLHEHKRPLLGFGFSHGGGELNLFDFHSFAGANQDDIVDFTFQWDQGLAPAAHFAFTMDAATVASGEASANARSYLERQAHNAHLNCDLVVIGQTLVAGSLEPRRWFLDRNLPGRRQFRSEDPSLGHRSARRFAAGAAHHGERHVFIGYPLGYGERIALDRDMDGVTDFDEAAAGTDPDDASSPGSPVAQRPAFLAPPEVLWVNTRHARLNLETDQPTTILVEHREVGGHAWTETRPITGLSRVHAPLLRDLRASTRRSPNATVVTPVPDEDLRYEVRVTARNRSGRTRTSGIIQFEAAPFIIHAEFLEGTSGSDKLRHEALVISASELTETAPGTFRLDATMSYKRGGPALTVSPEDVIIIGRVLHETTNAAGEKRVEQLDPSDVTPGAGTLEFPVVAFTVNGGAPFFLQTGADFLLTEFPTDSAGHAALDFSIAPGILAAGDRVYFNIDAAVIVDPVQWPLNTGGGAVGLGIEVPVLAGRALSQWSFPDTGEAATAPGVDVQ